MELAILIIVVSVLVIIVNFFLLIFKRKSAYFKNILFGFLFLAIGSFIFMMSALKGVPKG
ncbi:hypothetical protein PKF05_05170 [Fusobacterium simiae]|uniref:DUF2759 domain-containing protein n=1 Tax=Fusobacterium simiae TaxID=855 RepID=A0ABT4DI08_FUSSI|nr:MULTISPECIES: hypothetical protein [Fusobacterium]MCY7008235.1 hypothetical protein [Fusobacterium simiae]MDC7955227.1 hypothetical protein [Fusobacterium simiae]